MLQVIEVYYISWNTFAMKQSTIFQKIQKLNYSNQHELFLMNDICGKIQKM